MKPSLFALAALAGLNAAALKATVDKHNAACTSGIFAAAAPPRTTSRHAPAPIATPPFYALPACAGITFSMPGARSLPGGRHKLGSTAI